MLLSLELQKWRLLRARSSLIFRQTMECWFFLKLVRDMIITYSQMHRTDKYSQHISMIWPVRLNASVFVYNLSACGFECRCYHLKFKFDSLSWDFLTIIAFGFFSFNNFLRFTFYLGRYTFFFFLLTYQFLLIWSFFAIFYCLFSFWIQFSLFFNILFSWKSFLYSSFVNFKSLTYSCIVLTFFCIMIWKFETWKSFSVSTSVSAFCCLFLLILFMLKIQSKNLRWGIFFLHLKIQSPCYCRQLILFQNPRCHQQFLLWNYLQSAAFAN